MADEPLPRELVHDGPVAAERIAVEPEVGGGGPQPVRCAGGDDHDLAAGLLHASEGAACPLGDAPVGAQQGPVEVGRDQPKNAFATAYQSSGTVLSSAVASASETSTMLSPRRAAIRPKRPSPTRSAAFSP